MIFPSIGQEVFMAISVHNENDGDISTMGWDVVNATTIDSLNQIIESQGDFLDSFSATSIVAGTTVTAKGKWGKVNIPNNASGARINLVMEIEQGEIYFDNKNNEPTIMSINDNESYSTLEVEVQLAGLGTDPNDWDHGDSIVTGDTKGYELKLNKDQVIIIVNSNFTNPEIEAEGFTEIIQAIFKRWLNDNKDLFNQIFSVVLIGLKTEDTDLAWLYPSAYAYAANSSIDQGHGVFGILTLVDGGTEIGGLQQSVSLAAINKVQTYDANVALILSREKFVKHILMQCAVNLITGSSEDSFKISENGLSLTNPEEITWGNFYYEGDNGYHTTTIPAEGMLISLQADYISIQIIGAHFKPHPEVTVFMNVTQECRIKVDENDKGELILVADEQGLGEADVNCETVISDWMNQMKFITGIILIIASVLSFGTSLLGRLGSEAVDSVAGEATGEVSWYFRLFGKKVPLGSLSNIAAMLSKGVEAYPTLFNAARIGSTWMSVVSGLAFGSLSLFDAIYSGIYKDIPSFKHIAKTFIDPTVWPGLEDAELKTAFLANSFVVGLKLK